MLVMDPNAKLHAKCSINQASDRYIVSQTKKAMVLLMVYSMNVSWCLGPYQVLDEFIGGECDDFHTLSHATAQSQAMQAGVQLPRLRERGQNTNGFYWGPYNIY